MSIKFTLSLIVLFFAALFWAAYFPHVNKHALTFSGYDEGTINAVFDTDIALPAGMFLLTALLLSVLLFSADNIHTVFHVFRKHSFIRRLISKNRVQCCLKFCRITGMALPLLFSQITYSQCLNINSSSWNKNTSVTNNIIYYDGTQTRLANSASSNARIADATVVNWSTAVYTTPTILPAASGSGTVTVPVGQKQTLSAIYVAPNNTPADNTELWKIGWAYNTAFTGSAYSNTSYTGTDGKNFSFLTHMDAKASPGKNNYKFIDEKLKTGNNFYRLKITYPNKEIVFSEIKLIKYGKEDDLVKLYPNPTEGIIYFEFDGKAGEEAQVWVSNILGQSIQKHMVIYAEDGKNYVKMDLSGFAQGAYLFNYQNSNGKSQVIKFVKTN